MTLISVPEAGPTIGGLLREWRVARRLSQLDLSLDANVSARHLSCVETGKARPSRQMIEQLAHVLGVPMRERNALLIAGGFAPVFPETPLSAPQLAPMQQAIGLILDQQHPYPAFVTNRYWDILQVNDGMARLFRTLRGGDPSHPNVLHQIFDPADMRPLIGNWEEIASDLVHHLHQDVALAPSNPRLRGLLDEVLGYPGVPESWRYRGTARAPQPVMTTHFVKDRLELRFFSTITTFAAARDITLDEVRIECLYPVDEATALHCRMLAGG